MYHLAKKNYGIACGEETSSQRRNLLPGHGEPKREAAGNSAVEEENGQGPQWPSVTKCLALERNHAQSVNFCLVHFTCDGDEKLNFFLKSPVLLGSNEGGRNMAINFFASLAAALKSTHIYSISDIVLNLLLSLWEVQHQHHPSLSLPLCPSSERTVKSQA